MSIKGQDMYMKHYEKQAVEEKCTKNAMVNVQKKYSLFMLCLSFRLPFSLMQKGVVVRRLVE
jgi:hypothetical protein